nr:MAG TPA: SINGLE STRANDED DNA BINDING PROTEIN/RNA BARREL, PROTEIN-DNA COMPLEX, REPLICATION-RNA.2A [Caudoviricetes sp.]
MEIQGRIKTIFATETVGQNGFQKRDLVITTDGQYPQDIIIQFQQGNCAVLDRFQVGQIVKIHFNLQGREWTSPQGEVKYFNTVVGWKIEVVQPMQQYQQPMQYQQAPQGYVQPPQGYAQQPQYAPPQQTQPYPQQGHPQYQQGQMFNQYGQAPAQDDGMPF